MQFERHWVTTVDMRQELSYSLVLFRYFHLY